MKTSNNSSMKQKQIIKIIAETAKASLRLLVNDARIELATCCDMSILLCFCKADVLEESVNWNKVSSDENIHNHYTNRPNFLRALAKNQLIQIYKTVI